MELCITNPSGEALSGRSDRVDVEGFARLAESNRPGLFKLARRLLRNADDANDVVQETMVKALRALPSFERDRPFRPWLFRICANCCVDFARERRRRLARLDADLPDVADPREGIDETVGASLAGRQVAEALERLPAPYRRILFMRHFEDKDVNEIARELNRPEGTIKSWLHRARALMRRELPSPSP